MKPFQPFHDSDFLVIPLTIMDGPLFQMNSSPADAWLRCQELIDVAERNQGVLTVLWHNNRFNDREYPGQSGVYEKLIVECKKRGALIARCCDVYSWCLNHDH